MSLIDAIAKMFSSRATSSASNEDPSNITAPFGRLPGGESEGAIKESSLGTNKESIFGTINKGSSVGPLIAYQNLGEPVWPSLLG